MSAYGFKAYWEEPLMTGRKLTTLRIDRKDGRAPKVGERFSAFVHGESEFEPMNYAIYRDGEMLSTGQASKLAVGDGFENLEAFVKFFEVHHSLATKIFEGWLIAWRPRSEASAEAALCAGTQRQEER